MERICDFLVGTPQSTCQTGGRSWSFPCASMTDWSSPSQRAFHCIRTSHAGDPHTRKEIGCQIHLGPSCLVACTSEAHEVHARPSEDFPATSNVAMLPDAVGFESKCGSSLPRVATWCSVVSLCGNLAQACPVWQLGSSLPCFALVAKR